MARSRSTAHTRPPLTALREAARSGPPYAAGWLDGLAADPRAGAQALHRACVARLVRYEAERERLDRMLAMETACRAAGATCIAGVDEAGRGPLAGPIVAAAAILAAPIAGLDDSKRLSRPRREALHGALCSGEHRIGLAVVDAAAIDAMGIQRANYTAMRLAVMQLDPRPDYLLVDGFAIPECAIAQRRVIGGDGLSLSIAAASIVAKVERDRIMDALGALYPAYGFGRNRGYGTAAHLAALRRHGPSPVHRRSFAPLASPEQPDLPGAGSDRRGEDGLACES